MNNHQCHKCRRDLLTDEAAFAYSSPVARVVPIFVVRVPLCDSCWRRFMRWLTEAPTALPEELAAAPAAAIQIQREQEAQGI